jgi:hypothetical protein
MALWESCPKTFRKLERPLILRDKRDNEQWNDGAGSPGTKLAPSKYHARSVLVHMPIPLSHQSNFGRMHLQILLKSVSARLLPHPHSSEPRPILGFPTTQLVPIRLKPLTMLERTLSHIKTNQCTPVNIKAAPHRSGRSYILVWTSAGARTYVHKDTGA